MEESKIIDETLDEGKSLARRKSITFKNDAVLITQACAPSTPIYAALSFLLKQEERFANGPGNTTFNGVNKGGDTDELGLGVEDCLVMIYTAVEKEYGAFWEEDPECTKIQFDEWLLENGTKGRFARLFQRIQIV
jgi:hypothetical protein